MNGQRTHRREEELLAALKLSGKVSLSEAMEILGVSESTVRRLFTRLEQTGIVTRAYGSVTLAGANGSYVYDMLESRCVEEKARIGECAAKIVRSDDIVFLDSGTTVAHMCVALAKRFENGELSNVKLFTNSLVNLNLIQNAAQIVVIGGEYRQHRRDFCGYLAEKTLKSLHFTKCFLGTDGYSLDSGFTTTDFSTARLNEIVTDISEKKFVLADSTKLNKASIISYSAAASINFIITDSMPEEYASLYTTRGISIIRA